MMQLPDTDEYTDVYSVTVSGDHLSRGTITALMAGPYAIPMSVL